MRLRRVSFFLAASWLLAGIPAWSQSPVLVLAGRAPLDGPSVYRAYCAACHGAAGKGDGPVAAELKHRPTDLTTIARNNKAIFPRTMIEDVITNGTSRKAHGSREMPTWGPVFQTIDQDDNIAHAHIHNLVTYLESIQVK